MGLLDGKTLLVTGVLKDNSIAFHVARLAQQEGAEPRTVDEQVALDPLAAREADCADVTASAVALHVDHQPFGAPSAHLLGERSQVRREQQRVELIGVAEGARQLSAVRRRRRETLRAGERAGIGERLDRRLAGHHRQILAGGPVAPAERGGRNRIPRARP